jgi:hypothetical protein
MVRAGFLNHTNAFQVKGENFLNVFNDTKYEHLKANVNMIATVLSELEVFSEHQFADLLQTNALEDLAAFIFIQVSYLLGLP